MSLTPNLLRRYREFAAYPANVVIAAASVDAAFFSIRRLNVSNSTLSAAPAKFGKVVCSTFDH
jgi:hypothetical protein